MAMMPKKVNFKCMTNEKTQEIIKQLQKITASGYRADDIFRDWIDLIIYALMGDDKNYLEIVRRYKNDRPAGNREIDFFKNAFHLLLKSMKETNDDLLGKIYMDWCITNKHTGQFFTPTSIASFMAKITNPKGNILDPYSGSGIMLVEFIKAMKNEDIEKSVFVGQDLDPICTKMTALNLTFFNVDGYAIQGNSLISEVNFGYKISRSYLGGSIRELTDKEIKNLTPKIAHAINHPPKQQPLF
jgi:type I restriction-modification system DNA methylase subunit